MNTESTVKKSMSIGPQAYKNHRGNKSSLYIATNESDTAENTITDIALEQKMQMNDKIKTKVLKQQRTMNDKKEKQMVFHFQTWCPKRI